MSQHEVSLFFALFPDDKFAWKLHRQAAAWRHDFELEGRQIAPMRLHVTLHHLGRHQELPAELKSSAAAAAALVQAQPFEVEFDCLSSFESRSGGAPLVLLGSKNAELIAFQNALGESLRTLGLPVEERPFNPHLTLLRDKKTLPVREIQPVSWQVKEFCLVRSLIGRGTYEVLAKWPLGPDPKNRSHGVAQEPRNGIDAALPGAPEAG